MTKPPKEVTKLLVEFYNGRHNTVNGIEADAERIAGVLMAMCLPKPINVMKLAELERRLGDGTAYSSEDVVD